MTPQLKIVDENFRARPTYTTTSVGKLYRAAPVQVQVPEATPVPVFSWGRAVGGSLVGALIPFSAYVVGHVEIDHTVAGWYWDPMMVPVAGALIFSAKTVYQWSKECFRGDAWKGLGFTVLAEVVMTCSATWWLALIMLAFLMGINAIASGIIAGRGAS